MEPAAEHRCHSRFIAVTPPWHDQVMDSLNISCDDCSMQHTAVCEGCVVSFICDRDPDDAIIIDVAEERAIRMLGRSGLVPPLRHHRGPTSASG